MMKKIVSIILTLMLTLSSFGMAFAATPTDVKDTSYQTAVETLVELGIVNGYPDGTFKPEKVVTRGEMAKFVITALEMDDKGIVLYSSKFKDVGNHWAKGYIGYASHLGLINGYPDSTFKQNNPVSYDEATAMIVRSLGYTDSVLTGNWPQNYRTKAQELGIVKADGVQPKDATRGDVAFMINQALSKPIGAVSKDGKWIASDGDTMKARLTTDEEKTELGKIPYGSRLIHEYGLDGAVTDSTKNIQPSKYYDQPDFYNLTSSKTLTMLPNFKTIQQATSWTCGPTSAVMLLEWYGQREDLNELDLANLRGKAFGGATTLKGMVGIFNELETKLGQKWDVVSSYDLDYDKDGAPMLEVEKGKTLYLEETIPYYLNKGMPIIIGWQEWAGHYQVVIGYDTMGTEATQDDVIIFADPYDTTDHLQDGYVIQSYERFIYDWSASFDPDFDSGIFLVASPETYKYTPAISGKTITPDLSNNGRFTNDQMIPFGDTLAKQLAELSKTYNAPIVLDTDGLSGPAGVSYNRAGDYNHSPYYKFLDSYNLSDSGSLQILEKYKTIQQATEYTCGVTSMVTVLEWYGKRGTMNEMDLAAKRDKKDNLPGTTVQEMLNVINNLDSKWTVKSSYDIIEGDSDLESGIMIDGKYKDLGEMIPYYIEKNVPVMVMWHEWGGHWQVIIGYDDMGTNATQDDILILADPYDTTDHNQDGYVIESFERFIYDWGNTYDKNVPWGGFVVMEPTK